MHVSNASARWPWSGPDVELAVLDGIDEGSPFSGSEAEGRLGRILGVTHRNAFGSDRDCDAVEHAAGAAGFRDLKGPILHIHGKTPTVR